MAELLNHSHCKSCDRAVKAGEDVCGPECQASWTAMKKKRARTALFFYVASAVLVLVLIMQLLPGLR